MLEYKSHGLTSGYSNLAYVFIRGVVLSLDKYTDQGETQKLERGETAVDNQLLTDIKYSAYKILETFGKSLDANKQLPADISNLYTEVVVKQLNENNIQFDIKPESRMGQYLQQNCPSYQFSTPTFSQTPQPGLSSDSDKDDTPASTPSPRF